MTAAALIARCPGCNTTAPVVQCRELWTGDVVQVFAPHGNCRGGSEPGEVLADTPENREALAAKWIGANVCPDCQQRPVTRKGLCASCADFKERPPLRVRAPVHQRRVRGRR